MDWLQQHLHHLATLSPQGRVTFVIDNHPLYHDLAPYQLDADDWDKMLALNDKNALGNYEIQGDAKLSGAIGEWMSRLYPEAGWGSHKHARAALVSNATFFQLMEKMDSLAGASGFKKTISNAFEVYYFWLHRRDRAAALFWIGTVFGPLIHAILHDAPNSPWLASFNVEHKFRKREECDRDCERNDPPAKRVKVDFADDSQQPQSALGYSTHLPSGARSSGDTHQDACTTALLGGSSARPTSDDDKDLPRDPAESPGGSDQCPKTPSSRLHELDELLDGQMMDLSAKPSRRAMADYKSLTWPSSTADRAVALGRDRLSTDTLAAFSLSCSSSLLPQGELTALRSATVHRLHRLVTLINHLELELDGKSPRQAMNALYYYVSEDETSLAWNKTWLARLLQPIRNRARQRQNGIPVIAAGGSGATRMALLALRSRSKLLGASRPSVLYQAIPAEPLAFESRSRSSSAKMPRKRVSTQMPDYGRRHGTSNTNRSSSRSLSLSLNRRKEDERDRSWAVDSQPLRDERVHHRSNDCRDYLLQDQHRSRQHPFEREEHHHPPRYPEHCDRPEHLPAERYCPSGSEHSRAALSDLKNLPRVNGDGARLPVNKSHQGEENDRHWHPQRRDNDHRSESHRQSGCDHSRYYRPAEPYAYARKDYEDRRQDYRGYSRADHQKTGLEDREYLERHYRPHQRQHQSPHRSRSRSSDDHRGERR
ncbi:hypothetical protein MKEN_01378300 [Mycena kentingensis (nom. inval.)]|nr:hypothetical protein MKEN_01378300 [Mycena kentingensis (nom. inval.)]